MVERMTPIQLDFTGFQPQVADKVIRLVLVLDRLSTHPFAKDRLCLHGGTALNLFVLGVPRLSVDIDLNYIGSTDRTRMLDERPAIERAVMDIAHELGFVVTAGKPEHSGRSFRLQYQTRYGADNVKIDIDYLNRSPLLPVESRTVVLASSAQVTFPLNADLELFAGKTKALLERVAVRDLYDVGQIAAIYSTKLAEGDETLLRRVMLYYLSISAPFPRPFDVSGRFAGRRRDVEDALHPMLLAGNHPGLEDMIEVAQSFVDRVSRPIDESEARYLACAAKAKFVPALLFADHPFTLQAAENDPAAAWKMQNLASAKAGCEHGK
jgi:predicted nucleotidyltransferase component of viral defense system